MVEAIGGLSIVQCQTKPASSKSTKDFEAMQVGNQWRRGFLTLKISVRRHRVLACLPAHIHITSATQPFDSPPLAARKAKGNIGGRGPTKGMCIWYPHRAATAESALVTVAESDGKERGRCHENEASSDPGQV